MLKDMKIATALARDLGLPSALGEAAVQRWAQAADDLPADADHTASPLARRTPGRPAVLADRIPA